MSKSNVTLYTTPSQRWKIGTKVHQSLIASLAALVVLLAAAACGGSGSNEADDHPSTHGPSTTAARPPPTTPTPPSTQDQVKQAYEEFLDMFERITTTSVDPTDPELTMRMADPAL